MYKRQVASGSDDKTVKLWDVTSGECLKTLIGHGKSVWTVSFSQDGKQLASGSDDKTVKLWDVEGNKEDFLTVSGYTVTSVAFSKLQGHLFTVFALSGDTLIIIRPLTETGTMEAENEMTQALKHLCLRF